MEEKNGELKIPETLQNLQKSTKIAKLKKTKKNSMKNCKTQTKIILLNITINKQ